MNITEFLEARIVEDEAVVAYAEPQEMSGGYSYADVGGLSEVLTVGAARVLAECAAKRAIIAEHGRGDSYVSDWCETCAQWWASEVGEGPPGVAWPCLTLKVLAAVYSDHPDYQQEWAL